MLVRRSFWLCNLMLWITFWCIHYMAPQQQGIQGTYPVKGFLGQIYRWKMSTNCRNKFGGKLVQEQIFCYLCTFLSSLTYRKFNWLGHGHFFLRLLWHTYCTFGCYCMAVYLLKFPRPASIPAKRDSDLLLPWFCNFLCPKVVAHQTTIALISPYLKTMGKHSTGKYYVRLLLKRCKIHFIELILESNITVFLSCGISNTVEDVKFYDHTPRNSASFEL